MASETFYPIASGDDGTVFDKYSSVNSTNPELIFGLYGGYSRHCWIRFPNINIPQGSTITQAYLTFTAWESSYGIDYCNANIYFNDIDNAVAPTSHAEFGALDLTSAIAWDVIPEWTLNNSYNSISIISILQPIVDRGGWVSGNAMMVAIKDNGSVDYAFRSSYSYDGSGAKAELHVTWEEPPPPIEAEISEDVNVLSEFDDNFGELNEDVNVLSDFDDNWPEVDENISVSSEFDALGSENISEEVSVNSEFVSEHTGDLNDEVSVNSEFVSEHTGDLSDEVSVNSGFVCYQQPANLNVTLPCITAEIFDGSGGFLNVTLPCINARLRGGAQLEVTLPALIASLEGKVGKVGNLDAILPMLVATIEGKVGILGDINVTLPAIRGYIAGKTGDIATCNVILPMILADIQGYHDLTGNLDATLPMILPYMVGTTERATCQVLRYVEPI